jgi:ribose transport system substrate-binding protein
VKEANEKEIPTVIFDSGLDPSFTDFVSYVATDNYNGGALAARCLGEALKKKSSAE